MRIISGFLKNRKLAESSSFKDLRPTTDRNRESLFNILNSKKFFDFEIQDATILDLCCGTGAVAFEAISRGAKKAFLVDNNSKHLEIAKENAKKFEISQKVEFFLCDCTSFKLEEKFDLIFLDPPYSMQFDDVIKNIIKNKLLDKNTLLIIESSKEYECEELKLLDHRKYGISHFSFFKMK